MYTMVKETPELMAKPVITAETNRKGIIEVFNAIEDEDAVYITAPDPIEHPMNLSVVQIEDALSLPHDSIRTDLPKDEELEDEFDEEDSDEWDEDEE